MTAAAQTTEAVGVFDGVLYGAKHLVVPFVTSRIHHLGPNGLGPLEGLQALGVVRDGAFIGGVVFGNFRPGDVEVSIAFDDARWPSRRTLARLFAYPFVQLGLRRITAIVAADNAHTIRLMAGIGWVLEGRHRRAIAEDVDALSYGMLAEECRWLRNNRYARLD